jgi:hypothetical protein
MTLHRAAVVVHAALASLFPREFRLRYRDEMQLDFTDELHACPTGSEVCGTACRAYGDLLVSVVREWRRSEAIRLLFYAGLAHGGMWLIAVAIASWEWPGGSRLYPLVATFALLSAPGIAVALWRQRFQQASGYCSLGVAELD